MADPQMQQGSPFWRFSLRFYRRPGAADACIALQDGCGVDVNILLFLLWLATARRRVPVAAAQEICAKAAGWREDVVTPLRTLRRRLKDGSTLVERGAAELFRTRIKAAELESERLQQEAMFVLAEGLATECRHDRGRRTRQYSGLRAGIGANIRAAAGRCAPQRAFGR